MDFSLSEEQTLLVGSTRDMLARWSPIGAVRALAEDASVGFDQQVWRKGAELGWPALAVPEQFGGLGRDLCDVALVVEELGRTVQPGPLVSNALVAFALAESGQTEQWSDVLAELATGDSTATWALVEPGGDWDASAVRTSAEVEGQGYRLDGVKTAVQDAGTARWILVTARGADGPLQLLVDREALGVSVRRQRTIDPTRRHDEVRFDDVHVPASALLHGPDTADRAVARQLRNGAVLTSAESLGVGARLLEMSVEYALLRVQFGRPIGSFQAIKHKLADMRLGLQASTAATRYAAMAAAADAPDADEAASVAKTYTSTSVNRIASEALQVHGGTGFTWEHDLHLYLRRAKANAAVFGSPHRHNERLFRWLDASATAESATSLPADRPA